MDTKTTQVNIKSITTDKLTSVEIGGGFYQRLNKFLIDYCDSVEPKKLIIAMAKIKADKLVDKDDFTFNLETLIILVKAIEEAFENSGQTVSNDIELDLPVVDPPEEDLD
tara:strand:+ start:688 stop:1017 length:330 start_codon:yes stop_codon:yes gene_type:complete